MKHIYLDSDFDLVSWVMEHKDEIITYYAWDVGATIFEMENRETYCLYT
jgi:hypothetical protein